MRRALLLAAALVLVTAPAAHADVHYAGTAVRGSVPVVPSFSLVRRDDGVVRARVGFPFTCHGHRNYNLVARLRGRANGSAFTASGSTKGLRGVPRMRFTLTGTLTGDGGSGKIRLRVRGCRGYTRSVVFRTASGPVGAPAAPARNSLLVGFSSQSAAGLRLPVVLRVAKNGRVYAIWHVSLFCGRGKTAPSAAVSATGSATRTAPWSATA
jgi:hypothetical protein